MRAAPAYDCVKANMANWREHLRLIAILVNALTAIALVGVRGWWMSVGFGIPLIVAPVVAVVALIVNRARR